MILVWLYEHTSAAHAVRLLKSQLQAQAPSLRGACVSDGEDRVFVDVDSDIERWGGDQEGLAHFLEGPLRARRTFVVFLSKGVLEAEWCLWEVRLAMLLKKRVVVVVAEAGSAGGFFYYAHFILLESRCCSASYSKNNPG